MRREWPWMPISTAIPRPSSSSREVPASVAMVLRREDCASIRIAVLDPATDSVLVQSEEIPVRLGV